jgi:hypothetical protein
MLRTLDTGLVLKSGVCDEEVKAGRSLLYSTK